MRTQSYTLNNGIQLLATDLPDANSITLLLLVKAGSVDESIPGLAHLTEHTVFKGTAKRPTALAINNEIEKLGGYVNAETSQEYTEYYIKIPKEACRKGLDILSDIVSNSLFNTEEIEKEKEVISEEIHMYDDMPIRNVSDSFYAQVWKRDPYGRSILGTPEWIDKISPEDLHAFVHNRYTPDRIILSLAGDLSGIEVKNMSEEYFGCLKSGDTAYAVYNADEPFSYFDQGKKVSYENTGQCEIRLEERSLRQAHFCLGYEGISYADEGDLHAIEVAGGLLAEGSGSYLWQKVREELGASYYLDSAIDSFRKKGIWYIHCGVDDDKLVQVLLTIQKAIEKLRKGDFADFDMVRAKAFLKGDFIMNLEGTEEIARYVAHELFEHGALREIEVEKNALEVVTEEEIIEVVQKVTAGELYLNVLTNRSDMHTLMEVMH